MKYFYSLIFIFCSLSFADDPIWIEPETGRSFELLHRTNHGVLPVYIVRDTATDKIFYIQRDYTLQRSSLDRKASERAFSLHGAETQWLENNGIRARYLLVPSKGFSLRAALSQERSLSKQRIAIAERVFLDLFELHFIYLKMVIAHHRFHPDAIAVHESGRIRLQDFSRVSLAQRVLTHPGVVPQDFRAFEIANSLPSSSRADLFALSRTLTWILLGDADFQDIVRKAKGDYSIFAHEVESRKTKIQRAGGANILHWIEGLAHPDPRTRSLYAESFYVSRRGFGFIHAGGCERAMRVGF